MDNVTAGRAPLDISRSFDGHPWNDSKLQRVEVCPPQVVLHLLMSGGTLAHPEFDPARVIFSDCRGLFANIDLLAVGVLGGELSAAYCHSSSALRVRRIEDILTQFGVFREFASNLSELAEYHLFVFNFVHPGGLLEVLARDYSFESLADG